MTITIDPTPDAPLVERAQLEGISVSAYIERLVKADRATLDELEALALEGLKSGEPIATGPGYWEAKHRFLDERLSNIGAR